MHKHGGDIYSGQVRLDFSANMNPLGMPDRVRQAALEGVKRAENYPDPLCRDLRAAIARREQVPDDWVVCGNGAADLIYGLTLGLRPRNALLAAPGFAEYEEALEAAGCRISWYVTEPERNFCPDHDLIGRISRETDMVFLCNPNNPTGLTLDRDLLEKVEERCRECGTVLVVDECFLDLTPGGEDLSVRRLLSSDSRLFLLKAFTKLYAMPGLRLGYGLCGSRGILECLERVRQPWSVSLPAQLAGIAALEEEGFAARSREYIAGELAYLKEGLGRLGIRCWDSRANYIFLQGPGDLARRCREEGVLIRDCSNYRGLGPGYFRIAVRTRKENEELLTLLERLTGNPLSG